MRPLLRRHRGDRPCLSNKSSMLLWAVVVDLILDLQLHGKCINHGTRDLGSSSKRKKKRKKDTSSPFECLAGLVIKS